jgi:hypothetical protein
MAAIAIGAANGTTTIRAGNLVLQAEGVFSPKVLPRHTWAPITLNGHGSVATADGSHVPPVQSVHLQVDKHLRIESTGLPSCPLGKIEATTPSQAMKACGAALIGNGHATAEVAFPESAPFSAKGALLGFNGPTVRGYPEMLFYVNVAVPVPTTIVVVAQLAKDSGRYGYKISMAVPELAGGSGSLTGFELTIGRQWTYKGARHSYLSAQCPEGQFVNQVEAAFGDGTTLTGTLVSSCRPKG